MSKSGPAALFGNLVNELLPVFREDDAESAEAAAARMAQGPLFPEVDTLLGLFKDSCKKLVDLAAD